MNYLRKFCLPFHVNNYGPVTLSQITIRRTSDVFGERGLGIVSCQSKFFSSQSTGSYPCIIAVQAVDVLHYRNRIQRMRHTFRKGHAYLFCLLFKTGSASLFYVVVSETVKGMYLVTCLRQITLIGTSMRHFQSFYNFSSLSGIQISQENISKQRSQKNRFRKY